MASGITMGNAPSGQEATALESASAAQQAQAQNAAESYLQAGVSPEDVQYRQIQQQLGNLSSYWSGQTPLAQFPSLSASEIGAAPTGTNYQATGFPNENAGVLSEEQANQLYSGNVNFYESQINPYMAGLSTIGSAGSYLSSPYLNPFGGGSGAANPYGQLLAGEGVSGAPSDYQY